MRLLLVTSEPGWADALRSCFAATDTVVPAEMRHVSANPALAAACDACFVAEASISPWTVDTLKQVSALSEIPLFVLSDSPRSQWEDAALFAGAQQVFHRPLRGGVLQLAISRCQRRSIDVVGTSAAPVRPGPTATDGAAMPVALALWRDFSRLLASAGHQQLLRDEYLRRLRDVLRCSRLVVYLPDENDGDRIFRCAFAVGSNVADFDGFPLSPRAGVLQVLLDRGTVVWRQRLRGDFAREAVAARELMVFGAEVAVPVVAPRGIVGAVFVGPRISGGDYGEEEISLVYHALEGLGSLIGSNDRVDSAPAAAASDSSVLQAMPIAAARVSGGLRLLEVNPLFRSVLGRTEACTLTFDELPADWSAPITAAVQGRAASARVELEHRTLGAPRKLRLTVQRLAGPVTDPTFLVTVEDAQPAAIAAQEADAHSIHNLLQRAGEQLSNEFRNALTPVDIMVQLSRDSSTSRTELERLGSQVGTAIHRLRRRIDDLAYLTKNAIIPESTTVSEVLRFTRERLVDWLEARHLKRVVWLNEFSESSLMADSRALALAMAELVMNAVEACDGRQVTVSAEENGDVVSFRVRNSGTWAPPPESSGFRHRPFVSTKSTGVGLGVEVASRVAEYHGGRLVLGPVAADSVEAILRLPRNQPVSVRGETRASGLS